MKRVQHHRARHWPVWQDQDFRQNGYPLHSRSLKGWGWIVNGNDLMVRCRPTGDGVLDEAMEEQSAGLGAPAVEAEGEFVEVVVEMLELDATLMGSHQPS